MSEPIISVSGLRGIVGSSLTPEIAIRYATETLLDDLKDVPVWVDGSGLSRYNLLTPETIVRVWEKIDSCMGRKRLFSILAVGGVSGTLKNSYKGDNPYIFGKTGTLRNQHSLSGFLVTKRGRTLIFSWMNNNFTVPSGIVRGQMERILKIIYDRY